MPKKNSIALPMWLGAAVVLSDQISKAWVRGAFVEGEALPVVPGFFNLTLAFNRGTAFGMFSQLPDGIRQTVLGLATCLALIVVIGLLRSPAYRDLFPRSALVLILSGAFGNIIDRTWFGAVTDFLDVYAGTYHWPTFNIADSAICVGVGMLLIYRPKREVAESGVTAEFRAAP